MGNPSAVVAHGRGARTRNGVGSIVFQDSTARAVKNRESLHDESGCHRFSHPSATDSLPTAPFNPPPAPNANTFLPAYGGSWGPLTTRWMTWLSSSIAAALKPGGLF